MFARIGSQALKKVFTPQALESITNCGKKTVSNPISGAITDSVSLTSKRIKDLELFYSNGIRKNLFKFHKNGEITTLTRTYGSDDLKFLDHIRTGKYVQPKMYEEGTLSLSKAAMEQSNRLTKEIISENEKLINGFRYNGPKAEFSSTGKNISRFRNGTQETTVIDTNIDKILNKTIGTFENRISQKNYTETEKINELMKFVDEVFSVSKSGSGTQKLAENMHSGQIREVLLGDIINSGAGMCRHRSLLTKVLGDKIGLKTRLIQGHYGQGGHAWNEIITKDGKTYLFDAMHGNIFNVSNTSKNVVPQVFHYKITDPKNADKLIGKYFNQESPAGLMYRYMQHKMPINTSVGKLTPTTNGYTIEPIADQISVNGKNILTNTEVHAGDWVQVKDIGFQII